MFLSPQMQVIEIFPHGRQWFVTLNIKYPDCWWPCDARTRDTSSQGTDVILTGYSFSTSGLRVRLHINPVVRFHDALLKYIDLCSVYCHGPRSINYLCVCEIWWYWMVPVQISSAWKHLVIKVRNIVKHVLLVTGISYHILDETNVLHLRIGVSRLTMTAAKHR